MLTRIATHHIHLRERDVLPEYQASADGREQGKAVGDGNYPLKGAGGNGKRCVVLILQEIVRVERIRAMEPHALGREVGIVVCLVMKVGKVAEEMLVVHLETFVAHLMEETSVVIQVVLHAHAETEIA